MKKIFKKLKKCRSCKSKSLVKVYENKPSPVGESFLSKRNSKLATNKTYPLNLLICKKCKLAQLDNIVDPNIVYKEYLYVTESNSGLVEHFKNASSQLISKLNLKKNSKVLDIGSNDGSLLNFFKQKGHKVLGIEPAKLACRFSKLKGIDTIQSFFNTNLTKKIILKHGKFNLIIANNVFANIDDINLWLSNIKKLLNNDGSFVFESSYLLDLVKNNVFDFIYHEHLTYFSLTAVRNLCKKHGLKLYDYDHIKTKGGSIRYYISKDATKKISKKVISLLNYETKFGLFKKQKYNHMKSKINSSKKLINQHILENKNKRIIGFGASISCITLIYEFNLENKISLLIDDNKIKENKFSPGSQIKIISPNNINFSKNDIILILPWRFQKKILKKHKSKISKALETIQVWPYFKRLKI